MWYNKLTLKKSKEKGKMKIIIITGIVFFILFVFVFTLSLCKIAGEADKRAGYPPYNNKSEQDNE